MADTTSGRFDANLGDIMQNVRQIDSFLDVVFEFLYRRTDFYHIMKHEDDTIGLPPGIARKYVMQAYMKYERMSQEIEKKVSSKGEKKGAAAENVDEPPPALETVEVATTDTSELPGGPRPVGGTCAETGASTDGPQPVMTNPDTGEVIQGCGGATGGQRSTTTTTTTKDKTSTSKELQLNKADTYNGALRENYAWSQTLKDVDIKVFVPSNVTKAKQVTVDVKNDQIKVSMKGSSSDGQGEKVLVEGQLVEKVKGEESIWSLEPGKCIQLNLEKRKQTWWKAVFVGEPEIDQKSIDNVQYVHEMDDESQLDYQRVMYDMERKRQGLPTSKEQETHSMLRKAWDAEGSPFKGTEFDPSKVNISAS
ncbi:nudC domain-containing protein 3-like [Diadema antillarum]|uniref:nudC domain-containing protein 3-like n=1 Tax=Diadema antillarum TaxID=105358 RepID=UPI003A85E55C